MTTESRRFGPVTHFVLTALRLYVDGLKNNAFTVLGDYTKLGLSRIQMPVSASIYDQNPAVYTKSLVSYLKCCPPFYWAVSTLFQSDFSLVFPLPSLREPSNKIDQTNEDWNLD